MARAFLDISSLEPLYPDSLDPMERPVIDKPLGRGC